MTRTSISTRIRQLALAKRTKAGSGALLRASLFVIAISSCSRGDSATNEAAATSDATTPMGAMGGKSDAESAAMEGVTPTELRFTAAQVMHGAVAWAPVTMGTAVASATVPGQLVPNEDRTSRLGAPAEGRVISVRVQPGDHVARGELLVTLQSSAAGAAQADLAKAVAERTSRSAEAEYARSARDRAERLLLLKAIPRQDYERAVADDVLARGALAQADAELQRARTTAAQLGAGASASGEISLRSPFAGVVLARTAVPGTVVEAGTPLVIVTDPASLWLTVSTPEQLAGLFHSGGHLRFVVPAYPADTFDARVETVGAGLDPDTRTLPIRASVTSGAGRLKPEMLASVTVTGGQTVSAVLLPVDAVQLLQGKPTVFVATPDGKGGARLTRRDVQVGESANGFIAVTRGLQSGDVVVFKGAYAVKAEFQKSGAPKMEM